MVRVAAAVVITGVVVGFVAVAMADALTAQVDFLSIRWGYVVPAVLVQIVTLFALPRLWLVVLRVIAKQDVPLPRTPLLLAFSRSWLGRYLPGRVWYVGGRTALALRQGVDALTLGRSALFEIVFSYGTITILGLGLLVWASISPIAAVVLVAVSLLGLGIGVPLAERQAGRLGSWASKAPLIRRFVGGTKTGRPLSVRASLGLVAVYACHGGVQISGFLLLAMGILHGAPTNLAAVAAAWTLGSVAGYVSFVTPAGLGVREAVTLVLLSGSMSPTDAALVAAGSRVVLIASDIAFVALAEAVAAWPSHLSKDHTPAAIESGVN